MENKALVAVLGTIFVMLIGLLAWLNVTKTTVDAQSDLPALSMTFSAGSSASNLKIERPSSQTETQKVLVDIKGAIGNEGIYELSSGSRVTDVVKLAGGLTEDVNKKSANLAEKATDEAMIYVAGVGENAVPATANPQTNGSAQQEKSSDKINLNVATLVEFQMIPGIGAKRAQDIIDYRDANGDSSSADDLANVPGTGEKTPEKPRSEVTVN